MLYLIAGISFVVVFLFLFFYKLGEKKGFCLRTFILRILNIIGNFFKKLFYKVFKKGAEPEKKEKVKKEIKPISYLTIVKVVSVIAVVIFFVRYMSFKEVQLLEGEERIFDFRPAGAGPFDKPILNQLGNVCIWFEFVAFLTIVTAPFFDSKITKFISLYVSAPLILACFAGMPLMYGMMVGHQKIGFTYKMFGIEMGILVALCAMNWLVNWKTKFYRPTIIKGLVTTIIFLIFSIPTYLPQSLFGQAPALWNAYNLSSTHRIFIYCFILIPPLPLYFFLRNQSKPFIRYTLLNISTGVMILFVAFTKYDAFMEPWRWPLHLCNTAVFVMPFCFVFKAKRLFYFTYFINVFGAMFAILMPNTGDMVNIMHPDIWRYWFDHSIAFWMPLLAVAVRVFERPKLKQYFFSTVWFTVYFVFCVVINTVFRAYGGYIYQTKSVYDGLNFVEPYTKYHMVHGSNFFFANSDFLPKKFGELGKKIYNIEWHFHFKNAPSDAIVYPAFQIPYYIVYVLLGFGMWFVYVLFFKISEEHYELRLKLKAIKADRLALESKMDGRSIQEPMDKNAGISYKLIDFSKKYAGRKVFAVEHANLEVHGGEIFGFLGPNGAGKSTIIKSTVGIQPITSGRIEICGYDVQSQPIEAKSLIGFVPDHYALYEKLSGREYLNYIADIYKVSKQDREERLDKYIKLFELEGAIDNKIKTYSHGMKQKITIMAALVHDPKIWILDEPLTGLDPQSIFQVKQCMIEHAKKGNIVFFSSHIIDVVEKLCDKIAIIKKGHIMCVRDTKDVEAEAGSLERYYLDMIGDTVTKRK